MKKKENNFIFLNKSQKNDFYQIYKINFYFDFKYNKVLRKIRKFFTDFYFNTKKKFYIKIIRTISIFVVEKNVRI